MSITSSLLGKISDWKKTAIGQGTCRARLTPDSPKLHIKMASKKINLVRIAHVYYQHKNIDAARTFYEDFGMLETARVGNRTYYRGYGKEPFVVCAEEGNSDVFLGPAFVVESMEDLEHASKTLPDATEIYDLGEKKGAPGGGKCVTFTDPNDGFYFHLVYGQEAVAASEPHFPEMKVNFVSFSPRETETRKGVMRGMRIAHGKKIAHGEESPCQREAEVHEEARAGA